MILHFAPLQGYADHLYRRFHAQVYGPADTYYTPFIRIDKGEPRRQDLNRLEQSLDDGTNLVPQIIFKDITEFGILAEAVKAKGYKRIDINLGCPYPMQTRKGRGAAMISNIDVMCQVSRLIREDADTVYSIKMRLGLNDANEWRQLMPILNDTPLSHITMHPRMATQMYDGEMFPDEFQQLVERSKNPVIWNGDILTIDDIDRIGKLYPAITGIMIGRGMLARPSLIAEWREAREWDHDERLNKLLALHSLLFEAYEATLCGPTQILQKIKPFWEYLEPEIGHKCHKAIRKAGSIAKYRAAIDAICM